MWTQFWDMHSGGGCKEKPFEKIYIEAPEDEARSVFYARFGHNPSRVTCTCCGEDYSVSESETLERATGYHRNCEYAYFDKKGVEQELPEGMNHAWANGEGWIQRTVERQRVTKWGVPGPYIPLNEYIAMPDVLVIYAAEIADDERRHDVPEEGYVWQ